MNKELLYKYFAGEATPDEEMEIMDWTELSSDNLEIYLKERKAWNAVLVNYDSDPAVKPVRTKSPVNIWMVTAIAASVALLFVLSLSIFKTDVQEDKWHTVWVPPGQRTLITLDDGTTVWLNSQSTFTFPSVFNKEQRIVQLNGEGFFEVEKDGTKPFIVQTQKYNVEVLGTSFNVFAYDDYNTFETSLLNGSVQIRSAKNNAPLVTLNPNQRVTETAGKLYTGLIDNFDHFRWREGLICLDDIRFEDLINKFSLYFDIKISIENKKLLDYRCTGKFRQSDGVDYALKVLQTEMKFKYTRDKDTNEIIIQ